MRTVAASDVAVLPIGRAESGGGIADAAALLLLGKPMGGMATGPAEPVAWSAAGFW